MHSILLERIWKVPSQKSKTNALLANANSSRHSTSLHAKVPYVSVDIAQYCQCNFLVTLKNDKVANNTLFSLELRT